VKKRTLTAVFLAVVFCSATYFLGNSVAKSFLDIRKQECATYGMDRSGEFCARYARLSGILSAQFFLQRIGIDLTDLCLDEVASYSSQDYPGNALVLQSLALNHLVVKSHFYEIPLNAFYERLAQFNRLTNASFESNSFYFISATKLLHGLTNTLNSKFNDGTLSARDIALSIENVEIVRNTIDRFSNDQSFCLKALQERSQERMFLKLGNAYFSTMNKIDPSIIHPDSFGCKINK